METSARKCVICGKETIGLIVCSARCAEVAKNRKKWETFKVCFFIACIAVPVIMLLIIVWLLT